MTDYAAAAVQPIVQGLITVSALGGVVSFTGRGALLVPSAQASPNGVGRDNTHPQGVFVLTLDQGLPGNAGEVEPTPDGALTPAAPLPRTLVDVRAPIVAGAPTVTTLISVSVAYGNFTVPAPADGGLRQVMIVVSTSGVVGGLADPFTPNANGLEVVVWAGVESP
jgi:hypothetical protein